MTRSTRSSGNQVEGLRRMIERVAALNSDECCVLPSSRACRYSAALRTISTSLRHAHEDRAQSSEIGGRISGRTEARRMGLVVMTQVAPDSCASSIAGSPPDCRNARRRVLARAAGQVVAEDAPPDERVDVQVQDVAVEVQVHRLLGDAELAGPGGGIHFAIAVVEAGHGVGRLSLEVLADDRLAGSIWEKTMAEKLNRTSARITQPKSQGASPGHALRHRPDRGRHGQAPGRASPACGTRATPATCTSTTWPPRSRRACAAAGLVGMRFNTIGVSDGISMGTEGMSYSLPRAT